ncbi:MAG: hypothetical protein AMXMBFR34_03600 [Myxococcaceae bacterium]
MIDALILDLGNVLAFHDNEKLFEAMAKAFRTSRKDLRVRLEGGLWDRVNRGQLPGDALRQELVARLGQEVSPDDWLALWNCHFTIHDEMARVVEGLVGKTRLVLLSNTHDQHVAWLRPRLPVLEKFDALVLSCEVGAVKPERAIYQRAVDAAQVPAHRAVFFDDVARYAEAAIEAGLQGRVFTTVPHFLDDLRELGVD